mgnify:CR=1 FL=1
MPSSCQDEAKGEDARGLEDGLALDDAAKVVEGPFDGDRLRHSVVLRRVVRITRVVIVAALDDAASADFAALALAKPSPAINPDPEAPPPSMPLLRGRGGAPLIGNDGYGKG